MAERDLYQMRELSGQFTPIIPVYPEPSPTAKAIDRTIENIGQFELPGLPATVPMEPLVGGGGFRERLAEHQAKASKVGPGPLERLASSVMGLFSSPEARADPVEQRNRVMAMAQQAGAAAQADHQARQAQQAAKAERLRNATKTRTIKETGTGDVTMKEEFTTDDGKITMERSSNKYEEQFKDAQRRTAEQQQYYDLLQRAAGQQQRQTNLAPVMQFIDEFTGSQLARGYQDPNVTAQRELAGRIRAAGALAKESLAPRERAYKRMMDMANLDIRRGQAEAARIRAAQGKKPKRINLVNEARIGEGKTIEARGLQDVMRRSDVKDKVLKGLSKDVSLMEAGIRIPKGWDAPLKAIMTTQNPKDITPQKKSMLSTLINEARAIKDEAGNRKYSDEDIREQLPSFVTDIDNTIAEITAYYGQR